MNKYIWSTISEREVSVLEPSRWWRLILLPPKKSGGMPDVSFNEFLQLFLYVKLRDP